jgi:hypothetical protein
MQPTPNSGEIANAYIIPNFSHGLRNKEDAGRCVYRTKNGPPTGGAAPFESINPTRLREARNSVPLRRLLLNNVEYATMGTRKVRRRIGGEVSSVPHATPKSVQFGGTNLITFRIPFVLAKKSRVARSGPTGASPAPVGDPRIVVKLMSHQEFRSAKKTAHRVVNFSINVEDARGVLRTSNNIAVITITQARMNTENGAEKAYENKTVELAKRRAYLQFLV